MSLNARRAPLPRCVGGAGSYPDRLVIHPGGPLRASAGHETELPSGQRKRHGGDSEVMTRSWVPTELEERFSAATRTRTRERARLAYAMRFHSSADERTAII